MARPPSDIRDRVLEASRARFLGEGVDGASLRDIARDAGTSLGMVVYYFPKKEDLFLEVVEVVYAPFLADVVRLLDEGTTTREKLRRMLLRIANASTRELDVVRLIAREAIGSTTRRRRILRRFMSGHIPYLLAAFADGVGRGELDGAIPLPVILVSFIGMCALPQVIKRALGARVGIAFPGREALAELSIELFFRAMGPRAG